MVYNVIQLTLMIGRKNYNPTYVMFFHFNHKCMKKGIKIDDKKYFVYKS